MQPCDRRGSRIRDGGADFLFHGRRLKRKSGSAAVFSFIKSGGPLATSGGGSIEVNEGVVCVDAELAFRLQSELVSVS